MKILDGKKIASKVLEDLRSEIEKENITPGLGVVLVGSDEASKIYVSLKKKAAQEVGIDFRLVELSKDSSTQDIVDEVEKLNNDDSINGIIVQLPLPIGLDKNKIISSIDPRKDVDGFHPENIDKFFSGEDTFLPVFPAAIWEIIKSSGEKLENKKAIIICNSDDFGSAMHKTLENERIFSEYFFSNKLGENLEKIKKADIVITACGKAGILSGEMMKESVIVVDGGIVKQGKKVVGDVDFDSTKEVAGFLSPVPGGVGPVTIACLLRNVFLSYKKSH